MISRLNFIRQKGMSLLSLLVALSLFSGIFLTFNQWGNAQRKSAVKILKESARRIAVLNKQRP